MSPTGHTEFATDSLLISLAWHVLFFFSSCMYDAKTQTLFYTSRSSSPQILTRWSRRLSEAPDGPAGEKRTLVEEVIIGKAPVSHPPTYPRPSSSSGVRADGSRAVRRATSGG